MRDRTKNKILDVSMQLFGALGLQKTKVEDIVEHAEISRATFYNYFHSKDEVTFCLIDGQFDKLAEQMRQAIENETDPYQKLKAFFVCEMNGVVEMNRILNVGIEDFELVPAIPRKLVMAKIESDLEMITDILAYGVSSGMFKVDDLRLTANIIMSTLYIYVGPFSTEKMNLRSIEDDVDRLMKALYFGFVKRPSENDSAADSDMDPSRI
jgi:AcrR family transcriptional regulator